MSTRFAALLAAIVILQAASFAWAADLPKPNAQPGDRVDIVVFGEPLAGPGFSGVEWTNPRNVYEVRITGVDVQTAAKFRVEWWGSVWPAHGSGGWAKLDDPWNGKWVPIEGSFKPVSDGLLAFTFPTLAKSEWEEALEPGQYPDRKAPVCRRTLKVRVAAKEGGSVPSSLRLSVYTDSRWRHETFHIEKRCPADGSLAGRISIINGYVTGVVSLPAPRSVTVDGTSWREESVAGGSVGVAVGVLYAANADLDSHDLTRVTVRMGAEPWATGFSFLPQDVLADGVMRVPSLDTLVSLPSRHLTFANDPGPDDRYWNEPVRLRVTERPEMTRARAMSGIPRLAPPQWVPIGVPSARQEFYISPEGDWSMWSASLGKRFPAVWKAGRDSQRVPYRRADENHLAEKFFIMLDTREQPAFDGGGREGLTRWIEDGYLPLIHAEWSTGTIRYHHSLVATILLGDYGDDETRRGDETVVLLSRLDATNVADSPKKATVSIRYSHNTPIELQESGTVSILPPTDTPVPQGLTATRGRISMDSPADGGAAGWTQRPGGDPTCSDILAWSDTLAPGATRSMYFKTPFVDLLDDEELHRLEAMSYTEELPRVLGYWRDRLARGMIIEVPDKAVNDFYRANLWHNVITTDRDPTTGLYNANVGTVRYHVYANETVMIARSMDMRGEHKEAERYIEPFLRFQGQEALTGRFSTKENVFHSAGHHTHGEYAMNHGFTMWGIADHYLITRDRAYLERVAPQIIKGCDFLIGERRSTMSPPNSPRSPIHGLSPASSLEDVIEFQYWFSTNSYFFLGMKRVAEALADINHPEAGRIAQEAEAYRRDIEIAMREATTVAAAVRLHDGNFVPYTPSRVHHARHLTEGWIREALYPALHLATAEVVTPDDPLITWMLDDLEDNIFFSWQSGYNVSDFERTWFERGAVTLQPCLLDTPTIYMARDEIQAALRSFWNTYALSIHPDTTCFAEWAQRLGVPGGPLYKTSDESRYVMWLRELLVWEDGDSLRLGRAMPREWLQDGKTVRVENAATKFGTASLIVRSHVDNGRIHATVQVPKRQTPKEVWLRLRHPHAYVPARVTVNDRPLPAGQIVGEDLRLVPGDFDLTRPLTIVAEYAHPR